MAKIWLIGSDKYGVTTLVERKMIGNHYYEEHAWYQEEAVIEQIKMILQNMHERFIEENRVGFVGPDGVFVIDNIWNIEPEFREFLLNRSISTEHSIRSLILWKRLLLTGVLLLPSEYSNTKEEMQKFWEKSFMANATKLSSMSVHDGKLYSIHINDDLFVDSSYALSSRMSEERFQDLLQTEAGYYFQKYGKMYLHDSTLLMAIAMQESNFQHDCYLPGGEKYNGYAIGIGQLGDAPVDAWQESVYKAYNFETNTVDEATLSLENVMDLEMNIKLMAMRFQNLLKHFDYNIYAAIQSYNYGIPVMDRIIDDYAETLGVERDDVLTNREDLGWISLVKEVHQNPTLFVPGWTGKTYGDGSYLEHVLSYLPQNDLIFYQVTPESVLDDTIKSESSKELILELRK